MKILRECLYTCKICGKIHGKVHELYNGIVPVYCPCDLRKEDVLKSPSMICPEGGRIRIVWTPVSDHLNEDGKWWHVPGFSFQGGWNTEHCKGENIWGKIKSAWRIWKYYNL